MPLSYEDVRDLYDPMQESGATTEDLPTWSARMNELTGSNMYSAGLHDNIIKRASLGIDRLLEATGTPELAGEAGRALGGLVGAPEEGEQIGRKSPRMLLNFAPLLIPGGGAVGAALKYGATAALSGAETYTETDSPLAGILSGITAAGVPTATAALEQSILRRMGARPLANLATGDILRYVPETVPQKAASFLGGQVGAAGLFGVSGAAQEAAAGQPVSSPFTTSNLLNLTLGQLPFAAIHLGTKLTSPGLSGDKLRTALDLSAAKIKLSEAERDISNKATNEEPPDVKQPPPEEVRYAVLRETRQLLSDVRSQQRTIMKADNLTDEQKVEELNKSLNQDYELQQKHDIESGLTTLGDMVDSETPRQDVIGAQLWANSKGTFRVVHVSDDPFNPPELRNQVVGYSTKNEPNPVFGLQSLETPYGNLARYSLPPDQWRRITSKEDYDAKYGKRPSGQMMLTPRAQQMTEEELSAYMHDLDKVHDEVDTASTPADLENAVVGLQHVEESNNLKPTTDTDLAVPAQERIVAGDDPATATKAAIKARAKRAARKIEAQQQRVADVQTGGEFFAQQQELSKDVPELQTEMNNMKLLGERLATKSTTYADTLLSGDMFRMYKDWVVGGRVGGFERFAKDVWDTAKTGKGLVKDTPTLDEVAPAAKESTEVRNIVDDAAHTVTTQSNQARETYAAWEKTHPNETTFEEDQDMFKSMAGQLGRVKDLSPEEKQDFVDYWADTTGRPPQEVKDEVNAFLERPHVKVWTNELEDNLSQRRDVNSEPPVSKIVRSAGNQFLFAMAPYDPETNRLGGKHTLPRDSIIPVDTFQKIGGVGKPLNNTELNLYRRVVPEAFSQMLPPKGSGLAPGTETVNVRTLDEGLKQAAPVAESKTLTADQTMSNEDMQRYDSIDRARRQLQHQAETQYPAYRIDDFGMISDATPSVMGVGGELRPRRYTGFGSAEREREYQALPEGLRDLSRQVGEMRRMLDDMENVDDYSGAGGVWPEIAPKPEDQMPGLVARLVRVPFKMPINPPRTPESRAEKGILYSGPHFGAEDQNVLGFARGYIDTLPNGKKTFHVFEVQSDWAQMKRDILNDYRKGEVTRQTGRYEEGDNFIFRHDPNKGGTMVRESALKEMGWKDRGLTGDELNNDVAQFVRDHAEQIWSRARQDHPLLDVPNELALKSIVQHVKELNANAKANGRPEDVIDNVTISDAETAMRTEGHDRGISEPRGPNPNIESFGPRDVKEGKYWLMDEANQIYGTYDTEQLAKRDTSVQWASPPTGQLRTVKADETNLNLAREAQRSFVPPPREEWASVANIPQAKGMYINYDQKLPKVMEQLTGKPGVPVDLGPHKESLTGSYSQLDADRGQIPQEQVGQPKPLEGSPVFKNPDGTPKTNITGRSYDISQVPSELTLTEPRREPPPLTEPKTQWVPQEQQDIDKMNEIGVNRGGRGVLDYLSRSQNPLISGLARDLSRFGDSLDRIGVQVSNNLDRSLAQIRTLGNGQFRIEMPPGYLRNDNSRIELGMAHELVHGLTLAELHNPANTALADGFTDLRNRVIGALPSDMKQAADKAIANGWYDSWSRGGTDFKSLMPNGTALQRHILYGLVDNDEFLSQGLSSPQFQEHLQNTKFAPQENVFHRMFNLVRETLNLGRDISDSAWTEFLTKSDQLLDRGNYIAAFRNFSDRHFENAGMAPTFVRMGTQRAVGLLSNGDLLGTPEGALNALRRGAGNVRSPEWQRAFGDARNMFNANNEDTAVTKNTLAEVGHRSDMTGLLDLADSIMLGKQEPDVLDILPPSASKLIGETARDAQNIFGALHSAAQEGNKGVLNLAHPEFVRSVAGNAIDNAERVVAQARLNDERVQAVKDAFTVAPNNYSEKIHSEPEALPEEFSGEPKQTQIGMVSRFLEPVAQIAKRIPESAEAISKGYQLQSNVRNMARESLKVLGMDLGTQQLTPKTVKDMFKTFGDTKLRKAAERWIYANQDEGEDSGSIKVLDEAHPRVQEALQGLNPSERDIVEDMVNKQSISTQHMQEQILEKRLQIAATNGVAVIQKTRPDLKFTQALDLSSRLVRAFTANQSDPTAAASAQSDIQYVQSKLNPDDFLNIARPMKAAADGWAAQQELFKNNPAFASAQRYGKFLVEYQKNGKRVLAGVDSRKEADALVGSRQYRLIPQGYDENRPPSLGVDAAGVANRLRELDNNYISIMQNSGAFTPDQIELMKKYSPAEQFVVEQAYGGVPGLQPQRRRLGKGAEDLPWLRNQVSWISQSANYWSRSLLRAEAAAHLQSPEIAGNPELHDLLQTHFDNIMQPDTSVGRWFRKAAMTWFMGYNPASALINGSQPFLTHVAELTSMTGKPLDSYRRVLGALKEVYASGLGHFEWKDPETAKFMHRYIQDGNADISMFDDQAAANELLHTNLVRALSGDKPQTLGQKLGTLAGNFSTVGMWMFKQVERMNAMSAGIAAFKYYREAMPELSWDDAYNKAVQFNQAVNYPGGAAARSVGAFAGRGAFPRTVAMLSTAMQSYNLGSMFQLARYIRSGYFRPSGLKPSEIYSARTAAVQMLGTQLAAAGVLGLPFASGMLSVLNQAFPGLEVNRRLRETVNKLTGGDDEGGSVLGDIAMTGVPSMMGWDLQSRLSMGNTLPGVSEVSGFDPQNLLGAPFNLVSNFIKGGQKLVAGDIHGIDDLMPSALKKVEQLLRSGGQVLDYRDRPIFTPTLGEKVGIGLGFNPKRLSDFNTAQRIARQADDNIKRREGQFHQQQAEEVLKGNFGSVRQALVQRAREDKTYDQANAVRSIASAAEELTFPRDLRREGTVRGSDVRSRLLATFNLPLTQPSEEDRLVFRHSVQQRLGLTTTSATDLQTAGLMDQLRQQQPGASRSELRRQATLLLHGRRRQMLPSLQE